MPAIPVVMSHGGYATFAFHVAGFGARFVHAPYRDFKNDAEALGAAARESQARLVYLANPDNPTGSWLSADEQMRLIDGLPKGAILVLDEAYSDFAPRGSLPELDPEDPRVIRVRTFSKAHGMAGMRVGYAIAPAAVIATFDKIRHHFGVSRLAQEAALASLGDQDFIRDVARKVAGGREDYRRIAERLSFATLPSSTNFVAFDMGSGARARATLGAPPRGGIVFSAHAGRGAARPARARHGRDGRGARGLRASAASAFCRSFRAEPSRVMPPPTKEGGTTWPRPNASRP